MGNIFNEFKKQVGYVNVTNQYIEMMVRTWVNEYSGLSIEEESRKVGLKVAKVPEDLSARISRQYIVNIHSCVEEFLMNFKDLPGTPTHSRIYDARYNKSRLRWTVEQCFTYIDDDVKELINICEYYRLMRNRIVHGQGKHEGEIKIIKSSIKMTSDDLITKVYGKLQVLNDLDKICFDDQVLFSRAAVYLAERIYQDSQYDWNIILSENKREIEKIVSSVANNKQKMKKKIKKYISETYYISNEELLDNELIDFIGAFA